MCHQRRGGSIAIDEALAKEDGETNDYDGCEGEKEPFAPDYSRARFLERGDVQVCAVILQEREQFVDGSPI
jgi:hypothetical protein